MKRFFIIPVICLFIISSCTKENTKTLEVTPNSIAVYSDGTKQLTTNVDDASFSSNDDYYATVTSSGLVTGERVGETEIIVKSSAGTVKVPITILNKYSLYPDVDGLIGKSTTSMTRLFGSNFKLSTSSSGDLMYGYTNPTNYVDGIVFSVNGSKINSIGVIVSTSYTSMLTKHLLERYMVAGMQNDMYFFLNHDENVIIGFEVYSYQYLMVIYMERTSSKAVGNIAFSHDMAKYYNSSK